jgi:hypothetical protein
MKPKKGTTPMTIRTTIIALTTGTALLFTQAHAGGPVITEDMTETAPRKDDRKIGGIILGVLAVAAIIALAGGSDTCTTEEPVEPEEPGVCD